MERQPPRLLRLIVSMERQPPRLLLLIGHAGGRRGDGGGWGVGWDGGGGGHAYVFPAKRQRWILIIT